MFELERLDEGTQFRLARVAAGLSQYDVATRAGVAPQRISELERGRGQLPPVVIERIRGVLDEANRAEAPDAAA